MIGGPNPCYFLCSFIDSLLLVLLSVIFGRESKYKINQSKLKIQITFFLCLCQQNIEIEKPFSSFPHLRRWDERWMCGSNKSKEKLYGKLWKSSTASVRRHTIYLPPSTPTYLTCMLLDSDILSIFELNAFTNSTLRIILIRQ